MRDVGRPGRDGLGPGWAGRPGARRRARLRRLASTLLLGLAVLVAGRAVQDRVSPATDPVVVATHDLAAGTVVSARDVGLVERPRVAALGSGSAAAAGASAAPGRLRDVIGTTLATTVGAGEEITRTRLVGADLLDGQPEGTRAFWLPADTAETLTGIGPGARVDVHSPGRPAAVLRGVLVLARTGDLGSGASLLGSGTPAAPGLLVAAPAEEAARVLGAVAGDGSTFRFALSPRVGRVGS